MMEYWVLKRNKAFYKIDRMLFDPTFHYSFIPIGAKPLSFISFDMIIFQILKDGFKPRNFLLMIHFNIQLPCKCDQ